MPVAESRRLLSFSFPDFDAGLEALRTIMRVGWKPPVLRLYDAMETGRHFGQWASDDACFLIVVTEGPSSLTSAEAEGCHAICSTHGASAVGDQPTAHWLHERNNVPKFEPFFEKGFVLDTIEVATGWDRIHDLYHEVVTAVRTVKDLIVVSGHTSHCYTQGTNIYFTFVARPENPADAEATYFQCWERTMEATRRCGGTIAHHHGIGRLRSRWMPDEHGEGLAILRALKQALDPHGIMNPGVLLPPEP
jgi:alkyldihydroxyacetonephosphate synthase